MIRPHQRNMKAHHQFGRMRARLMMFGLSLALVSGLGVLYLGHRSKAFSSGTVAARTYTLRGMIQKLEPEQKLLVIAHEAIPSYMPAMTMPFKVLLASDFNGLQVGDRILFRLSITETQSWIDRITKLTGSAVPSVVATATSAVPSSTEQRHPLLDYPFTNELGQAVTLRSFEGQALAITFFFTRCPIPDFCPRLSKNFAEASHKLSAMEHGPTNWHMLSISFDPEFDTPSVLKAYAEKYEYDPAHWSFLTGPKDQIAELARLSNVTFEPDSGLFNHNFRTMIIDASGGLQMVFPIGGDLSQAIVSEMLKATAAGKRKAS